jgi:hypothetical protein
MVEPKRILKARRYVADGEFRSEHKSARAFLAPQRDQPKPAAHKVAKFPKPVRRAYRGSDNSKARPRMSTKGRALTLVPREGGPMLPSARSRRERQNVWVAA